MDTNTIFAIGGIVFGAGGIWTVIQFFIQRHDNKKNLEKQFSEMKEKQQEEITKIYNKLDERDAILARTHILRFNDELENGMMHSKDYFRQQIQDIDTYEKYCRTHPDFSNGLTVLASKNIKEEYERIYQSHP